MHQGLQFQAKIFHSNSNVYLGSWLKRMKLVQIRKCAFHVQAKSASGSARSLTSNLSLKRALCLGQKLSDVQACDHYSMSTCLAELALILPLILAPEMQILCPAQSAHPWAHGRFLIARPSWVSFVQLFLKTIVKCNIQFIF